MRVARRERVAIHVRDDLERRALAAPDRLGDLLKALPHELAVALDVRVDIRERSPVAGQAKTRAEPLDDVERVQELTHRVGRVAVLEVQRDAPEEVVAGDQKPALGLEEAHVRRGVAGGLVHDPVAQVGAHHDAVDEVARGFDDACEARFAGFPLGRIAFQRLRGDAALARDLEPPREHRVGILDHAVEQLVARVHPDLAFRQLGDHGRLPAVVGVRVRANDQADLADRDAAHRERALEVRQRVRLVHAGVEQHVAAARGDRPRVAVRDAGPRQRQAQAVDARQHALAAAELAPRGRARRPRGRAGGRRLVCRLYAHLCHGHGAD